MDKRTTFMELSALLTGLYKIVNDPEDKQLNESTADKYIRLNESTADEYIRRLMGEFPVGLPKLLAAYDRLASAVPKPAIDDDLLQKLKAEPEFTDRDVLFVVKQIVNIWYFSQFNTPSGSTADGGFYERGLVWSIIKAHPIGYSNLPFGYWTKKP